MMALPISLNKKLGYYSRRYYLERVHFMYRRINSCLALSEGNCPQQLPISRVYLIPQLLAPGEREEYERVLLDCMQCAHYSEFRLQAVSPDTAQST